MMKGFLRFVQRSGLPFVPIATFDQEAVESRQVLYRRLAEVIWDPARIAAAVENT